MDIEIKYSIESNINNLIHYFNPWESTETQGTKRD